MPPEHLLCAWAGTDTVDAGADSDEDGPMFEHAQAREGDHQEAVKAIWSDTSPPARLAPPWAERLGATMAWVLGRVGCAEHADQAQRERGAGSDHVPLIGTDK